MTWIKYIGNDKPKTIQTKNMVQNSQWQKMSNSHNVICCSNQGLSFDFTSVEENCIIMVTPSVPI